MRILFRCTLYILSCLDSWQVFPEFRQTLRPHLRSHHSHHRLPRRYNHHPRHYQQSHCEAGKRHGCCGQPGGCQNPMGVAYDIPHHPHHAAHHHMLHHMALCAVGGLQSYCRAAMGLWHFCYHPWCSFSSCSVRPRSRRQASCDGCIWEGGTEHKILWALLLRITMAP